MLIREAKGKFMKKVFKSFILLVICLCACLTFTGCGTNWSKTTVETTGIESNGGIVVLAKEDSEKNKQLVAYVVPSDVENLEIS